MTSNTNLSRRGFLGLLGAAATMAAAPSWGDEATQPPRGKTKPIRGSWISVLWSDRRHFYWNDACAKFTREQWEYAVKEVADIGMQYLVLLATVEGGKAFFNTPLAPKAKELVCDNPIEAMLSAADKYGVKFFISAGFHGGWLDDAGMVDAKRAKERFKVMGQVAQQYGHHKSFHGWYLPDETGLVPYFTEEYIQYVNNYGREARRLTPGGKILIAPYGTHNAACDDKFAKQLERLEADIVAYQDEVGCRKGALDTSAAIFEKLRRVHDKVPQRALWADIEVFRWEGQPNVTTTPLIPAPFERIKRQLEAVSPYVDVVTIYQYQGFFNQPGSKAPAGHPDATRLYRDYVSWLKAEHPELVKAG